MFLSDKTKVNYHYTLIDLRISLEKYEHEFNMLGKYKDQRWYQKIMRKTSAELHERYYDLIKITETVEAIINEIQDELNSDWHNRKSAEESMKPFQNNILNQVSLKQLPLF